MVPRRPPLTLHLTRQVVELIRTDGLQRGDRLPSVAVLAERFDVATPTMREALRTLEASGVIEVRHGLGTFVRATRNRLVVSNPSGGSLEAAAVADLLDARVHLEPYLAALAARRRTEAEVRELENVLAEAERYLTAHDDRLFRTSMEFHRAIARASRQTILSEVIESLLDIYSHEQLAVYYIYDDYDRDFHEHRTILSAIADREAERAAALMEAHVRGVASIVRRRLEDLPDLDRVLDGDVTAGESEDS